MEAFQTATSAIFRGNVLELIALLDADAELIGQVEEVGGDTLLHAATFWSQLEAVKELIRRGSHLNARNLDGDTPLNQNFENEPDPRIIEYLLQQGADPEIPDNPGMTPLMWATARGDSTALECARLLVQHGAKIDLNSAISLKSVAEVKEMIESHPQGIQQAHRPDALLSDAIWNNDPQMVEMLLDHGVDADAELDNGRNPIFHALRRETNLEILRLLLAHGANPNALTVYDLSVLDYAECNQLGDEVLSLLIQFGAQATPDE